MFRHMDSEFALIHVRFPQGSSDRGPRPHRHPAAVLRLLQVQPPDRLRLRDAEPHRLVRRHPPLPHRQLLLRRPLCPLRGHRRCARPHGGRHAHHPEKHPRKAHRGRGEAAGRRCPGGLPALRRPRFLAGLLHCRQKAGQAHPHLCHRHGHRRHRPEICPPDRRVSGQRAPRDHHQPGHGPPAAWKRSSGCWAPGISPPSAPAWACTCCARPSTSRPTSACC